MKTPLFVVADDLTGANDTSVTFAEAGLVTVLALNLNILKKCSADFDVLAVSTGVRAKQDSAAARTAEVISAAGTQMGALYIKIDSTMRGSVQEQVTGALTAWKSHAPEVKAVICPAYPEMGRTIEKGVLRVHGIPVNETASGKDIISPVMSASMTELLPGAALFAAPESAESLVRQIRNCTAQEIIVDAASRTDLDRIAKAVFLSGDSVIPVGSAGLASSLAKILRSAAGSVPVREVTACSKRVLIVDTSIHRTSQLQIDGYIASPEGSRSVIFSPYPAQLVSDRAAPVLQQQLHDLLKIENANFIIRANPISLLKWHEDSSDIATAKKIAERFGYFAKYCLDAGDFGALVLIGGDGAAAVLSEMKVDMIKVQCAVAEGVPLASVLGTKYKNLPVITKSGGFGTPDLLCRVIKKLTE